MTRIDIDSVTNIIREVAAESILPRFRRLGQSDISFKIGDDPVTIADKEAESSLSTRLSRLLPGSKVVGEEAFAANRGVLDALFSESPVWIIDPVDGTRNFVKGSPEFGVIVALAEQNQTIAGWLYDPTSNEIITTEKGSGAWYKGKRLRIAAPAPLEKMLGFMGDRLLEAYQKANLSTHVQPVFEIMRAGVHEYPRLVLNEPHFGKNKPQIHFRTSYIFSTPWDDAAGVLVHQESGGYSAFWNGAPYQPSIMHEGLAVAPDKESWCALKTWCQQFVDLPSG